MAANFDAATVAEIHRLLRTTPYTCTQIAARLEISPQAVQRHGRAIPRAERFRPYSSAPPPHVTEAVKARIRDTTETYVGIAKAFGLTESTVRRYAATLPAGSFALRISNADRYMPESMTETVIELAIAGLTYAQIVAKIGYSEFCVGKRVRRHRATIDAARASKAVPVHCPATFADRLYAEGGWDDAFIASTVSNYPRLAVSARVSA